MMGGMVILLRRKRELIYNKKNIKKYKRDSFSVFLVRQGTLDLFLVFLKKKGGRE